MDIQYRHIQVNTLPLVILGPILILAFVIMLATRFEWVPVIVFIFLLLVLVVFLIQTVEIKQEKVETWFGPGLFHIALPMKEIVNLHIVRNSPLDGWGIQRAQSRLIINISGSEAVEIEMLDGNCIRIGSDDAKHLATTIENILIIKKKSSLEK